MANSKGSECSTRCPCFFLGPFSFLDPCSSLGPWSLRGRRLSTGLSLSVRFYVAVSALVLLTLSLWLLPGTPAVALQPAPEPPSGYHRSDCGDFWWASGSRNPPSEGFQRYFEQSLRDIRSRLGAQRQRKPLVINTGRRRQFEAVVQHYGGRRPGENVTAIAFPFLAIMVLDGERLGSLPPLHYPETVTHEIVHLVLAEGGPRVPRWYHEGLAQWLSGRRLDQAARNQLSYLAYEGDLIPLRRLSRFLTQSHKLENILYQQSLSFVEELDRIRGGEVHRELLAQMRGGQQFPAAFEKVTGESLEVAEERWLERLASEFSWVRSFLGLVGLFQVLALILIVGASVKLWQRRQRLRRMAEAEAQELEDEEAFPELTNED